MLNAYTSLPSSSEAHDLYAIFISLPSSYSNGTIPDPFSSPSSIRLAASSPTFLAPFSTSSSVASSVNNLSASKRIASTLSLLSLLLSSILPIENALEGSVAIFSVAMAPMFMFMNLEALPTAVYTPTKSLYCCSPFVLPKNI